MPEVARGLSWRRICSALPEPVAVALPVWAATRVAVLVVAYIAVVQIGFLPGSHLPFSVSDVPAFNLLARWDTGWYLPIAERGYAWSPRETGAQTSIVFFPLLPILMAGGGWLLGGHTMLAGWLVSMTAFLWALAYLYRLARLHMGDQAAAASLVFLAAYPFALFHGAVYTESIFLLCLVGSVFHAWRGQAFKAGLWGALCGLTRPNGFLLAVVLAFIATIPMLRRRLPVAAHRWLFGSCPAGGSRDLPPWPRLSTLLAVAAPVGGMLAYSAYIYSLTGNPFAWIAAQSAWGRSVRGGAPIVETLQAIHSLGFERWMNKPIDAMNELAALFALVAVWPVLRRFGAAYVLVIVVNLVPQLLSGGVTSLGRFTSVLFPVFLWLGASVPARRRGAWIAAFAMGQGIAAILFFTWRQLY
ncbi:MAG TPA: mannosyltransferase family protein [Vicinamibacterales bacterium]|jgi:hypothetical protein